MKKIILSIALTISLASAVCEFGHKTSMRMVGGGNYVATYYFSGHGSYQFTFRDFPPPYVRFDFYNMEICE